MYRIFKMSKVEYKIDMKSFFRYCSHKFVLFWQMGFILDIEFFSVKFCRKCYHWLKIKFRKMFWFVRSDRNDSNSIRFPWKEWIVPQWNGFVLLLNENFFLMFNKIRIEIHKTGQNKFSDAYRQASCLMKPKRASWLSPILPYNA